MNLRPFSGSRGANRIMTVGAVSASIPIDPSARSIRLVNSGSSICYVRIGQGEQTATSADVAVFGNSEVVLSKGEGEGTLAFISASGTTLQAQTGSGGTVPGYQVVDQLFLTGDGVTQSGQLVDQFGRTVKPVGDAALTRTDWQGTQALSATARTNLLVNAAWDGGVTPTGWTKASVGTQTSAPDGVENGGTAHLQSITSGRTYFSQAVTAEANKTYTISVKVHAANLMTAAQTIIPVGTPAGASTVYPVCGANPSGGPLGVLVPGWLECVVAIAVTPGTFSARIGAGASGDFTGTLRMSHPQVSKGASRGSWILTTTAPVTVTDYTLGAGGLITLGEVPVVDAQLKWSGIAIHT